MFSIGELGTGTHWVPASIQPKAKVFVLLATHWLLSFPNIFLFSISIHKALQFHSSLAFVHFLSGSVSVMFSLSLWEAKHKMAGKEREQQLLDGGSKLLNPPFSIDELLFILEVSNTYFFVCIYYDVHCTFTLWFLFI